MRINLECKYVNASRNTNCRRDETNLSGMESGSFLSYFVEKVDVTENLAKIY